ncbi:putative reverse transcriptase domain, ribonuclease H-like domain, aspartic peptidase domain protein, partial [Tanacetum coccineum]
MYHKKNVDYVYLLWEDFIYQVENKNVKKSNEMYYPRFTKVIINFFMTKDQSIPRRNNVNWHFARDDYMFTTIKVVSRHEDTQLYGAIFPNELTNEAIKDSESYKEYYVIASGAESPKTKASVKKKQARSDKAPKAPKGKRLKATAKVTKPSKKKLPDQGLKTLSEVALTEEEQIKLAIKRSLIETHSSQASGSDDEDNDDDDDDADDQDNDDQEDDDQNDEDQDDEHTNSDNDGDDFVHPKLSTQDQKVRHNEE